jgi:glutaredoxin 3
MVKEFLTQRGVGFQERDVSVDPAYADELVRNTGQMGVPVTIIDGQVVVGFDRGRLEQLLPRPDTAPHPPFGASIADASRITARQGPGIVFGAYVGKVRPGSVAAMAGLAAGDIITEINLRPVANAGDLEKALAKMSRGSRFSLSFLRGNDEMSSEGHF